MRMDQGSLSTGVAQNPNGEKLVRPVGQFECTVHRVANTPAEAAHIRMQLDRLMKDATAAH